MSHTVLLTKYQRFCVIEKKNTTAAEEAEKGKKSEGGKRKKMDRKESIERQNYLHWCSTESPWSKCRKRRRNRGKD